MDKIDEIAREENCARIDLCCWTFNKDAYDMYKHIGFNEQGIVLERDVNYER